MAANNNLSDYLTSVADALRAKGGTTDPINAQDFPSVIANLPSGGGGTQDVESKDIDFYDYLGNRVASWTLAELATKTELPAAPQHDGMTFQSWNWTLEQIKSENRPLDVGELCCTSDGVTRFYLDIPDYYSASVTVKLYLTLTSNGLINWGDGATTNATTDTTSYTHTYTSGGAKVIELTSTSTYSIGAKNTVVLSTTTSAESSPLLTKVELSQYVTGVVANGFNTARSLATVNTPLGMINASGNYFSGCRNLRCAIYDGGTYANVYNCASLETVCLSNNQTSVGAAGTLCAKKKWKSYPSNISSIAGFYANEFVEEVILPPTVTAITSNYFRNTNNMRYIELPSTLLTIGGAAFNQSKVLKIRFNSPTPPIANASDAFSNLSSCAIISVPTGTIDAYKAATNYPSNLTYIEED